MACCRPSRCHQEPPLNSNLFTFTRTLPVDRELVYRLWTEPKHIAASSAPAGGTFESPVLDLRPGGRHHYCARTAEGQATWGLREFTAVEPGRRLQWRQSFSDANGQPARHPMAPEFPLVLLSTLVFEDAGPGATRLTLTWEPWDAPEAERAFFASIHEGIRGGWTATFDQLERYLASLR